MLSIDLIMQLLSSQNIELSREEAWRYFSENGRNADRAVSAVLSDRNVITSPATPAANHDGGTENNLRLRQNPFPADDDDRAAKRTRPGTAPMKTDDYRAATETPNGNVDDVVNLLDLPSTPEDEKKKPAKSNDRDSSPDDANVVIDSLSPLLDDASFDNTGSDDDSSTNTSDDSDADDGSATNKKRSATKRTLVTPKSLHNPFSMGGMGIPTESGDISIIVKTLRGELFEFVANPACTIEDVRSAYWKSNDTWVGPPPKSLNFVCEKTHYFMEEGLTLTELGIKDQSILLLVIGNDTRHTGGFPFPSAGAGAVPPPKDIYKFEDCKEDNDLGIPASDSQHTATLPATFRRNGSDDEDSSEEDEDGDDSPPSKTAKVPGSIDITAIWDTHGEDTKVNGNTITHHERQQCTYFATIIVPPETLGILDDIGDKIPLDPNSSEDNELSFRLGGTKIGEATDLEHAMKKTQRLRTYYPHARIMVIYWLHKKGSRDVERALHSRFTLKRGMCSGEFFAFVNDVDWFQFAKLAEQTEGSTLVYASTNSFSSCYFDDIDFTDEKAGVVYKLSPNWSNRDKEIFKLAIKEHGSKEFHLPFQYHSNAEKVNIGTFFTILLTSFKIGRFSTTDVKEIRFHISAGALWAWGYVSSANYTTVCTKTTKELERKLHQELQYQHIAGEHFLPPPPDTQMSKELTSLVTNSPSTTMRYGQYMRATKYSLQRWVNLRCISYPIILECFKAGAFVLSEGEWPDSDVIIVLDPLEKVPAKQKDLEVWLKGHLFGSNYKNKKIPTTKVDTDINNALGKNGVSKRIYIKVNTNDFSAPTADDAIKAFIEVCGRQECLNE